MAYGLSIGTDFDDHERAKMTVTHHFTNTASFQSSLCKFEVNQRQKDIERSADFSNMQIVHRL